MPEREFPFAAASSLRGATGGGQGAPFRPFLPGLIPARSRPISGPFPPAPGHPRLLVGAAAARGEMRAEGPCPVLVFKAAPAEPTGPGRQRGRAPPCAELRELRERERRCRREERPRTPGRARTAVRWREPPGGIADMSSWRWTPDPFLTRN